tara:strand:+ start:3306 stop:3872 length:567 start_codon:yes stop_codon:yes gene_type:complete
MKYIKKNKINFFPLLLIIIATLTILKTTNIEKPEQANITPKTNEKPVYLELGDLDLQEEETSSEDTIFNDESDEEKSENFDIHIVESGESLTSIARDWGVTIQSIIELNKIKDPDKLKLGQELKIPLRNQWNSDYPEDDGLYRIKKGDTLEGIAKALNTTLDVLQELNPGIDPAKLKIGTMINVPVKN